MVNTEQQFDSVVAICRSVFSKKAKDYGSAWRILRPVSITDQLFIKANRIRSLELKGVSKVDEGIENEFVALLNYSVMGIIQLERGFASEADLSADEAIALYDEKCKVAKSLMMNKNHDYDEAWRSMRVSSFTDLILQKLYRVKQIEDNMGKTIISEGIDANYLDIFNYSVFALIKLEFGD